MKRSVEAARGLGEVAFDPPVQRSLSRRRERLGLDFLEHHFSVIHYPPSESRPGDSNPEPRLYESRALPLS